MSKNAAIVIVNYSNTNDTLECLDSLAKVKTKARLMPVVVHYRENKGQQKILKHSLKPTVLVEKENLGFAGFNNLGIKRAVTEGAEVIVLLNNDTTVDHDFLDPLIEGLDDKSVALVSPKIYFYPGNETYKYPKSNQGKVIWYGGGAIDWNNAYGFHKHVDEVDRGQADKAMTTDFATGCCLAFRSETYRQLEELPEEYFMYLEDVAWSVKAKELGLECYFEPRSKVWHKNAQSSGGTGSQLHLYYQTRNRIIFALKFAPLTTKLAILREAMGKFISPNEVERLAVIHGLTFRSGKFDQLNSMVKS
jgi:GT2 family glycosyltransferase